MGFTRSTTDISVHQKLGDYPNQDDGLTPEELKKRFDLPAEILQEDLNRLEEEIEDINASSKIGTTKLDENDTSEDNLLAKLIKLNEEIKNVILNQIPDGTITKEKMNAQYEKSLARKENLGKIYLASQYKRPDIETETPQEYTLPKLTADSHEGYEASWSYNSKSSELESVYEMFNGDGNLYIKPQEGSGTASVTIKLPNYFKMEKIYLKYYQGTIRIYGSNDNENWVLFKTLSTLDTSATTHEVEPNNYYRYYKIAITAYYDTVHINLDGILYNNISFSGKTITALSQNNMSIVAKEENELLVEYENGQILKLTTPSTFIDGYNINSTINVYGLGEKEVPSDMQPSRRYSLVYNGEKFVHESEVQNG